MSTVEWRGIVRPELFRSAQVFLVKRRSRRRLHEDESSLDLDNVVDVLCP
jgi:hypothetical protein